LVIVLLLTFAVFTLSVLPEAEAVEPPAGGLVSSVANFDRTEGDFSVSDDGAAQYTVPLWVPKGRGTVAPQLALSYDSGGGNGLLGVGWSMSGLSTIGPCARTIAQDGATGGVNFDSTDVYCLDGNRLVPVSGAGAAEREYRTEQETFSKIVAYGMQDGVPDSFKVWAKDGRILSYGATANARMQAFRLKAGTEPNTLVRASTSRVTVAWALNRVEDRNGNAATVEYERVEGTAGQLWHLESRPQVIRYAPNREVRFVYESRTDVLEGYGRGVHTREPKRLSRVEMWAGRSGTDPVPVRSYRLGYSNTASITGRSLLTSIVECDGNGVGTCKRPQTFDWSPGSLEFDPINLTGITDLDVGRYRPVGLPEVEGDNRIITGDINGDGRDDLLYPDSRTIVHVGQQQQWFVRLNTGTGFGNPVPAGFLPPRHGCSDPDDTDSCMPSEGQVRPIDADMDGRMDVAVWVPTGGGQHKWRLFVSNGTTFVPYAQELETVGESGNDPNPVYFGDVDGNGTPDYLTAPFAPASGGSGPISGPWTYRLNTGAAGAARFGPPVSTGRSSPPFTTHNKVVDVDADGRADLVGSVAVAGGGGLTVGWGLDAGGTAQARQYASAPHGSVAADVNGDGLEDAVDPFTLERATTLPRGSLRASLNSGNGYAPMSESPNNFWEPRVCCGDAPPPNGEPSFIDYGFDRGVRYADFTGDGNDDVLVFRGNTSTGAGDIQNGVQLYTWRDGRFERVPLGPNGLSAGNWGPNGFVSSQLLDFNGDGMLDIVNVQGFCVTGTPCHLQVLKRRGGVPDRLVGIGDSDVRERIAIDYTHLGNRSVHTPGTSCTYPARCVNTGGTAVMRHSITTFGGNDEATVDQYSHSYTGARQDLHGRGWLGFASHTVVRTSTGETTVTEFDNVARDPGTKAYPFAFMPNKVTVTVTDAPGVSGAREHQHTTVTEPFIHTYPGGTYRVEPLKVTETERERPVGGSWTVLRQRVTDNAFDNFGNLAKAETATAGGRKLVEDPTFSNDTEAWLIGLPTRQVTTGCTAAGVCTTRETTYDHDDAGNLTTTVVQPNQPALKLTTVTEFGTYGIVKTVTKTDNAGVSRKDVFEYGDADKVHPTATINAAGHKTTIVTDAGLGVPTRITDPNGFVTTMRYDHFGRLRGTFRADGTFERIDHSVDTDTGWQTATTTVAGGGKSEVVTDRLGRERQRAVLAFNGVMSRIYTTYDELGRVWSVSRPARAGEPLHSTITRYDNRDRVRTVTEPDGAVVATSYLNREVHTVDAKNVESYTVATVDGDIESSYQNDPNSTGWLRTWFEYGPFGETTKITAPDNTVQTMHYDRLGRRYQIVDPSAGTNTTGYNAFGEIVSDTDGNNRTSTHVRDSLGRITTTTSPDGTLTNVWDTAANGKGKLHKATSADGTVTTHTYGPLNQLTSTAWTVDGTTYAFEYGYDPANGRQTSLKYPAIPGVSGRLTINYSYNASGYLKTIRDAVTGGDIYWTAEDRDAAGQLTRERFDNGVTTEHTYDARTGLLDVVTVTGPGGRLAKVDYDYDLNRNVRLRHDVHNNRYETYSHDTLNRIKTWSTVNFGPSRPWVSANYSYDKVGNLKTEAFRAQGVNETTTYDHGGNGAPPHAMIKRNNTTYTYDNAGRQTSGAGRTIEYNQAGLPKKLTWGQGQETTFKYDASGARVLKRNGVSRIVTIGGLFERRDPAGTGSTDIHNLHNIVVDGRVVAQVNRVQANPTGPATTKTWYVHGDGQGSTMLVTNENGSSSGGPDGFLADLYYDPFGRRIDANYLPLGNQGHGGPRQGYTGHEHDDEYGLINMKGRIYDPETRRFLTPDPLVENPTNSQTLNRYTYVLNNPTTHTDPTGYQRSASYWDPHPYSYDPEEIAKAFKRARQALNQGKTVLLIVGDRAFLLNPGSAGGSSDDDTKTKAESREDARSTVAPTDHGPSNVDGSKPEQVAHDERERKLLADAERRAGKFRGSLERFDDETLSRFIRDSARYAKTDEDRYLWTVLHAWAQDVEHSRRTVVIGANGDISTEFQYRIHKRNTRNKDVATVLTGNLAAWMTYKLTGNVELAKLGGALFDHYGTHAGIHNMVRAFHVDPWLNPMDPKELGPVYDRHGNR
jgi:RHS repeat-associated protein